MGALPDTRAGAAGVAGAGYAAQRYGTYHTSDAALVAQRNTVVAGARAYPAITPAMYAGNANAWQPTNLRAASLYANPGYGAATAMLGMAATQPAPYDYGGNVVAQPTVVYVNGDPAGTPQQYSDQAGQIAAAGAAQQPDPNDQWLPLGIFAMVEPDQAQPTDLFQLAVNKQGVIRGNYHNVSSNETTPVAGSVDRTTQRAAWTIGGDKLPVYEAGLANLTTDQTTMLVHTPDGQQRQINLVRMPPSSGDAAQGGAPPAP